MFPLVTRSSRKLTLFNLIGTMLDKNERVSRLIHQTFKNFIGNDLIVDIWSNDGIGTGSLKDIFSQLFSLAMKKHRTVANFGHWNQGVCQ